MKILVHTCCGPCLTYPHKWLLENGFEPTAYYYNPNIYPEAEFVKRYFVLKDYANQKDIPLIFSFDKKQLTPGECTNCYEVRLRKTAQYAKENGFKFLTTTLLISPYQNHEMIKELGRVIGDEIGLKFLYNDFRIGFKESRDISKEFGLYRQKYCGCKYSLESRAEQCSARTGVRDESIKKVAA